MQSTLILVPLLAVAVWHGAMGQQRASGGGMARSADAPLRLTLREALERASRTHPRLAAAEQRIRAAESRIDRAEAWTPPLLAVEFFDIPASSLNLFRDNMEYDYSIEQMIPFPGKTRAMGDMERAGVRMERENAAMAGVRLAADIRVAHAMLWEAEAKIGILRTSLATAEQMAETVTARVMAARGTQVDALRAAQEVERLRVELLDAESELRVQQAMFAAAVGLSVGTTVSLADAPDTTLPAEALESLLPSAMERPDLRAMREESAMRRAEHTAMQRELWPDFMVRGMYKQMLMDKPDAWALMIGITVPVMPWSAGAFRGRAEEAEALARAAEREADDMRLMAEARVREAVERVRARHARLRSTTGALLPLAEQSFAAALAAYRSAGTDITPVLDSYRMLVMLRMERLMRTTELATARAQLALATGRDVQ